MKKKLSFLTTFLLIFKMIIGAPSLGTPVPFFQPDGKEVTIYLIGDEFFSYRTTLDGYLLVADSAKYLCYATLDDSNQPVSSGIRATQIDERDETTTSFLKTIDLEQQKENFNTSSSESRKNARRKMIPDYQSMAQIAANEEITRSSSKGEKKVLVVLVEYQDVRFSTASPQEAFNRMLNEEGYSQNGGTGSARDYFMECSYGKYQPEFDVYGPILMKNNRAYYGATNQRACEMAVEACDYLSEYENVDFSQYDNTNDGYIDNIFVFYAGHGKAEGGPDESVWPFAWYVRSGAGLWASYNGKILDRFACSNELRGGSGTNMVGIGTFCHEFSHVLGLADYYDTAGNGSFTPGNWDIMAGGNYNNSGRTPPYWCSFSRAQVGWLNPTNLNPTDSTVILNNLSEGKAYRIKTAKSNEYFLLENRQLLGFDKYLPASGMLIWHIDYDSNVWWSNSPNNDPQHQRVDIEEADNIRNNSTLAGDVFPGTSNVTMFSDDTKPGMLSWDNSRQEKVIREIKHAGRVVSFLYEENFEAPEAPSLEKANKFSSSSFTINWLKVDDADSYEIDVYRDLALGVFQRGYKALNVGNTSSFTVTDLKANTQYHFAVRSVKSYKKSVDSQIVTVRTTEEGFAGIIPEVNEPSIISENSFTLSWLPVEEAESYNVTVYKDTYGEELVSSYDFTTKFNPLPEGWESNCTSTVSTAANCGIAPPAMRATSSGLYISSAIKEWPINNISFWYRSTSLQPDNCLLISMYNGRYWSVTDSIPTLNCSDGKTFIKEDIDPEYFAAKIEYIRPSIGNVAIDDIIINHKEIVSVAVDKYESYNIGNETTFTFNMGDPNTRYRFFVTAQKGEELSKMSEEMIIKTLENNISNSLEDTNDDNIYYVSSTGSIMNMTNNNLPFSIYNTSGSLIKKGVINPGENKIKLNSGIYFIKVNDKVIKVII